MFCIVLLDLASHVLFFLQRSKKGVDMMKKIAFTVPEEFILMGLDRKSQWFEMNYRAYREIYCIGAIFIELILYKKVKMDPDGTVILLDPTLTGVVYIDQLLHVLQEEEKPQKLKDWMKKLYDRIPLRHRIYHHILEELEKKKAILIKEEKFMLVVPYEKVVVDHDILNYIIEKMRAEISKDDPIDVQAVALTCLLRKTRSLRLYFSKSEKEQLENKIEYLEAQTTERLQWMKSFSGAIRDVQATVSLSGVPS